MIGGRGIHVARPCRRARRVEGPCLVDRLGRERDRARRRHPSVTATMRGSPRSSSTWSARGPLRRLACVLPGPRLRGGRRRDPQCWDAIAPGLGARGLLNLQLALVATALRARGEPSRLTHRAFRREGDGRSPRRARGTPLLGEPLSALGFRNGRAFPCVGEGGDVPVRALRRERPSAGRRCARPARSWRAARLL